MIIMLIDNTAVGRRGTRPVSMNSLRMGAISATDDRAKKQPTAEKKAMGRSSLMKLTMHHRIRTPSL